MSTQMLHGSKVHGFKNTTVLIICNIQLPVHNGKRTPKDIILRSRPWGRLPMLRTILCCERQMAWLPVLLMAVLLKDQMGISGSSIRLFFRTLPADGESEWIVSPSIRMATCR